MNFGAKSSYLISLSNAIIPLFLVLYITEYEGLELAGTYFVLMSYAGLTQLFVDYGFNLGAIGRVGHKKEKNDESGIKKIILDIFILKILFLTVLLSAVITIDNAIFSISNQIFIAIFMGALSSLLSVTWLYVGLKKTFEYYLMLAIYRLLFLIPIFIIPTSATLYLLITLIPTLIPFFHSFKLFKGSTGYLYLIKSFKLYDLNATLRNYFALYLAGILGSGVTMSWPILLSQNLSISQIGAFGFADKIVKGVVTLFSPLIPLVLSSQININNLKRKVLIIFSLLLMVILFFTIIPVSYINLIDVDALTVIKLEFQYFFFLLPIYLMNMLLYTLLIMEKKEKFYTQVLLFSITATLLLSASNYNSYYLPVIYELCTMLILVSRSLIIRRNT